MASVGGVWQDARTIRAARGARPDYTPVLLRMVRVLATALPSWSRVRTTVLTLAGFAFLDYAAWRFNLIAGCVAVGVSLLALEALSSKDAP
jgi:hypothetical protein